MKRYGKTVAQQCRHYKVGNIYEHMVAIYINGNTNQFKKLFKELCKEAKQGFIQYCFSEVNPQYLQDIMETAVS